MGGDDDYSVVEKFQGSSLLIQHQSLLDAVDLFEKALNQARSGNGPDSSRLFIATHLTDFIARLRQHFGAESIGLEHEFEDEAEVYGRLLELEAEHPALLQGFTAVAQLLAEDAAVEEIFEALERAIIKFREHEVREDALFSAV
jgi:hypothetical protein